MTAVPRVRPEYPPVRWQSLSVVPVSFVFMSDASLSIVRMLVSMNVFVGGAINDDRIPTDMPDVRVTT